MWGTEVVTCLAITVLFCFLIVCPPECLSAQRLASAEPGYDDFRIITIIITIITTTTIIIK